LVVQIKEDEIGRACSLRRELRNSYKLLFGKPEGKRPLGRPRRRWVDHIKVYLREMVFAGCGLDSSGSG
jgi:hypothetical protein